MTELAALNVRITGDASGLKAAASGAVAQLAKVGAAANAASGRTGGLTSAFGKLGQMSGSTRAKIQNVGFQVQDMAVQFAAGTRASVVFAQQGSQIASVFGPVGAIIGTIAAVSLPLLAAAFASSGSATQNFADALKQAGESLGRLQEANAAFTAEGLVKLKEKYGEVNAEILVLIQRQQELAASQAIADVQAAMAALRDDLGTNVTRVMELGDMFGVASDEASWLAGTLDSIARSSSIEYQLQQLRLMQDSVVRITGGVGNMTVEQRKFYQQLVDAEAALRATDAATKAAGVSLSGMVAKAKELAGWLWDAAKGAAAIPQYSPQQIMDQGNKEYGGRGGDPRTSNDRGRTGNAFGGAVPNGGGGGSTNPIQSELEALQQSLMTQEQLQMESYLRQQETLRGALEQRFLTQEEFAALSEQAQQAHADRMAQIDASRYGTGLDKAGAFFGDMAQVLAHGNEKMLKVSQVFAAAEAWISTLKGAAKELEKGTLGFATAAMVIAKGAAFVAAIKGTGKGASGGGGRGGGGGSGSAAAAPAQAGTYVNVSLTGGNRYTEKEIRDLFEALNRGIENGGAIRGIRLT